MARSKRNTKPPSQSKSQVSKNRPGNGTPTASLNASEHSGKQSSGTNQSTPNEPKLTEEAKVNTDGRQGKEEKESSDEVYIFRHEKGNKSKSFALFVNNYKENLSPSNNLFKRWSISLIKGLASFFGVIKIELLIGSMAVILALGQYFYSGINTRMTIAALWREGYKAETRSRVAKFVYLFHIWQDRYEKDKNQSYNPDFTLYNLASPEKLFTPDFIQGDQNIRELVIDDIKLEKIKDKTTGKDRDITNGDYINAALNYRNAIIECLNTMEAVKAVIEAKPWPFRTQILYADTLEGRYKDIIEEQKDDLLPFINTYRDIHYKRQTKAWFVLTSEESNRNDYLVIKVYFFTFFLILIVIYFVKMLYRKYIGD